MSVSTSASVPTGNGSRYLQQLCKHWSHNLAVEYSAEEGRVTFPAQGRSGNWAGDATLFMKASPETLECRIDGSEPGQLEVLKRVVAEHLDRFAFREGPLTFDWRDG